MKAENRTEYKNVKGHAAWWLKDGLWHIALPFKPTDADRKKYPKSYPTGDDGPFFSWTYDNYKSRNEAIKAIKKASQP